jgi:hypothetical protein
VDDRHRAPASSKKAGFCCGECQSRLVYPTDSFQLDSPDWHVDLQCPECDWSGTVRCTWAELRRLDGELDRATSEIEGELKRLEALRMAEWVECFVRALDVGLIGPDDFDRS